MSAPVRLTIPASPAWIVLVRTAASACCARLDFPVDRLEDIRLAVDEVAALLVADSAPDAELVCELTPYDDGRLEVRMSAATTSRRLPATDSFAWTVLTALVDDVATQVDATRTTVVLRASAGTPVDA